MDASSSYTTTSATSSLTAFPPVTTQQRALLDAIVRRTPPGNFSTGPLLEAYKEVMAEHGIANDAEIYGIMLKLAYYSGDWRQRWRAALEQGDPHHPHEHRTPPSNRRGGGGMSSLSSVKAHLDQLDAAMRSTPRRPAEPTTPSPAFSNRLKQEEPLRSPLTSTPHTRQRFLTVPSTSARVTFANLAAPSSRDHPDESTFLDDSEAALEVDERDVDIRDAYTIAADHFRTLRLYGAPFDRWRARYKSQQRKERQTVQARDLVLLRHGFIVWAVRLRHRAALAARASLYRRTSLLSGPLTEWRAKVERRQRLRWEAMMRLKLDATRAATETRLIDTCWEKWVLATLHARAERFHAGSIATKALSAWMLGAKQAKQLQSRALQFERSNFVFRYFETWKRRASLVLVEQHVEMAVGRRILRTALQRWQSASDDLAAADDFYIHRLVKAAFGTWRHRLVGLAHLEERSRAVQQANDVARLGRAFRAWQLKHRGLAYETMRRRALLRGWRESTAKRANRRANQLTRIDAVRDGQTLHSALHRWHTRLERIRGFERAAAAGGDAVLASKVLLGWRTTLRRHDFVRAKAIEFDELNLRRRLFFRWQDVAGQRRLDRVGGVYMERKRKEDAAEMFKVWRDRLRQRRSLAMRAASFRRQSQQNIKTFSLRKWVDRVVNIREQLLEVDHQRQHDTLAIMLKTWRLKAAQRRRDAALLGDFAERQAKQRCASALQQWRLATRLAQRRQRRLGRFQDRQKRLLIGAVWDRWRYIVERQRLRRLYAECVQDRVDTILRTSLTRWRQRTTILPGVAYDKQRLLHQTLAIWRDRLPARTAQNLANSFDVRHTAGKAFLVWKNKRRERYARRQASRFRQTPPHAGPSTSAAMVKRASRLSYDPAGSSTSDDDIDAAPRPTPRSARPHHIQAVVPTITAGPVPRRESEMVRAIRESLAKGKSQSRFAL